MFVNLTNHPSTRWGEAQRVAAAAYGEIIDRPFPPIDPHATTGEVDEIVSRDVDELIDILYAEAKRQATQGQGPGYAINAIHLMGETTYVVLFSRAWAARGGMGYARLLCSTTERVVEELPNGEKKSTFKFVQFREM